MAVVSNLYRYSINQSYGKLEALNIYHMPIGNQASSYTFLCLQAIRHRQGCRRSHRHCHFGHVVRIKLQCLCLHLDIYSIVSKYCKSSQKCQVLAIISGQYFSPVQVLQGRPWRASHRWQDWLRTPAWEAGPCCICLSFDMILSGDDQYRELIILMDNNLSSCFE